MLNKTIQEIIREQKQRGVPNTVLMKLYKIDYPTLRIILDGGLENGSSINSGYEPNCS